MAKSKKELPMPKIKSSERHFSLRLAAVVLICLLRLVLRLDAKGIEKLPKRGPYILAANHVTDIDALAVAYFVYVKLKRAPHFLAKEGLFRAPVIGSILRGVGQIPVYRSGQSNDAPLRAAHAYLEAGHTIAIFPEGTLTHDPELWPMRGKSGAVRLALQTGVPIYPIGQWGTEKVMPQTGLKFRPGFWKQVNVLVGDEVDLSKYRNNQSKNDLNEATDLVMYAITDLVAELRGEKAPSKLPEPNKPGKPITAKSKEGE